MTQLQSLPSTETQRREDLKDVCHYYLAFMEEEASDGNQLKELKAVREKLTSQGHFDPASTSTVLAKIQNQLGSAGGSEPLGGVGRKRPNT